MEEQALLFKTYYEQQMEIAKRLVAIRKNRKISQKRLSVLSGVPYATIRKFEKTGDISFASFESKIASIISSGRKYMYLAPLATSIFTSS